MIALDNSIIFDFEGLGKSLAEELPPLPHMVGINDPHKQQGAKYRWAGFRESWKTAVNGSHADATTEKFSSCFEFLLTGLDPEFGRLVHWSSYEGHILRWHLAPEIWVKVSPILYNARIPAKKYVRANNLLETVVGAPLEKFFDLICPNNQVMPALKGGAAKACRNVDKACLDNYRWRNFSETQKKALHDLISYNEGDCKSTWKILKKVTNAGF